MQRTLEEKNGFQWAWGEGGGDKSKYFLNPILPGLFFEFLSLGRGGGTPNEVRLEREKHTFSSNVNFSCFLHR